MSDIRNLLSRAQEAEVKGDKREAADFLRKAAAWYRDRDMLRRAGQMLRQARRVEGVEEEEEEREEGEQPAPEEKPDAIFGFGEDFEAGAASLIEKRTPQLADPDADAWCSFCCRPKSEVGQLVQGPAGAFICEGCTSLSSSLRGRVTTSEVELSKLSFELPAQRRARERFTRLRSRLALVVGPTGSGKSIWVQSIAHPDVRIVEATRAFDHAGVAEWIASPQRSAVLVVTANVPAPSLVLQGEHGPEPLHDTAALVSALPQLPPTLAAQIDAVHAFDTLTEAELLSLARHVAQLRGVGLDDDVLSRLVSISARAGRGAHELVTLVHRIPPGRYSDRRDG
ncbi:MAG: ClpX C4-type zinc finger protein [Archangium sp.]